MTEQRVTLESDSFSEEPESVKAFYAIAKVKERQE